MHVRIDSVRVLHWKSIEDATIPIHPLVILYGANNAGKSNLLEAISWVGESSASAVRQDWASSQGFTGSVQYIVRYIGVEGRKRFLLDWTEEEARFWSPRLTATTPVPLTSEPSPVTPILQSPEPRDLKKALFSRHFGLAALEEESGGLVGDFIERFLVDPVVLLHLGPAPNCYLVKEKTCFGEQYEDYVASLRTLCAGTTARDLRSRKPEDIDKAGRFLLHGIEEVESMLASLESSNTKWVYVLSIPPTFQRLLPTNDPVEKARRLCKLGPIMVVRSDPVNLEQDIEAALVNLHDRVWGSPKLQRGEENPLLLGFLTSLISLTSLTEPVARPLGSLSSGMGDVDPWLEEAASLQTAEDGSPTPVKIRRTIPPIVGVIEQHANQVCAPIVKGRIRIRFLPISRWTSLGRKLDVSLVEEEVLGDACPAIPFGLLGSAVQRWVAAALRQACQDLINGRVQICQIDGTGKPRLLYAGEERQAIDILREQASLGQLEPFISIEPSRDRTLLLIDEPEQHLHPEGQEKLAKWLASEARKAGGTGQQSIIVATHSPAFLSLAPESASIIHIVRIAGKTQAVPLEQEMLSSLDRIANDLRFDMLASHLGLGRAGLLQLLRGVVIVEGEWDRRLLIEFWGDEMARHRLLAIPLHGLDRYQALTEGHIIRKLGIPVILFVDNVVKSHVLAASEPVDLTKEERTARQIVSRLEASGVRYCIVTFGEPDVIVALPEEGVRRWLRSKKSGVSFPGWEELKQEWSGQRHKPEGVTRFKQYAAEVLLDKCHGALRNSSSLTQALNNIFEGVLVKSGDLKPSEPYIAAVLEVYEHSIEF